MCQINKVDIDIENQMQAGVNSNHSRRKNSVIKWMDGEAGRREEQAGRLGKR